MLHLQKEKNISKRIAHLREKVLSSKSTVCTERATIYTEVYKKHADKSVIRRRALALEKTLLEMSIFIDDGELIVGNHSSALRAAPIFPEYAVSWIVKEMDEFDKRPGDAFYLKDSDKEKLYKICAWWEGKTLVEKGYEGMSERLKGIHETGIIRAEGNLTSGDGHIAVNFDRILEVGLNGYLGDIKKWRLENLGENRDRY